MKNSQTGELAACGKNRRRNYLINPLFQLKYTLTLVTGAFVASCFMGFSLYGFMFQQARAKAINPFSSSAWDNSIVIFFFALVFSAILMVVLGCWGVMVTHRVSGPMYVFQRNLKKLAQGYFPSYRPLRKRDEFKAVHEQFFQTVDSLRAARVHDVERLNSMISRMQKCEHVDGDAVQALVGGVLCDMNALRDELVKALDPKATTSPVPAEPAEPVGV